MESLLLFGRRILVPKNKMCFPTERFPQCNDCRAAETKEDAGMHLKAIHLFVFFFVGKSLYLETRGKGESLGYFGMFCYEQNCLIWNFRNTIGLGFQGVPFLGHHLL